MRRQTRIAIIVIGLSGLVLVILLVALARIRDDDAIAIWMISGFGAGQPLSELEARYGTPTVVRTVKSRDVGVLCGDVRNAERALEYHPQKTHGLAAIRRAVFGEPRAIAIVCVDRSDTIVETSILQWN